MVKFYHTKTKRSPKNTNCR